MNKKNEIKKRGRPKKEIDLKLVERLGKIMCTQEEIATILGVSHDTLSRNPDFCVVYKKALEDGKMSLRRTQFKLARTSASMAIFLGKQYLGQTDKVENKINGQLTIEDLLKKNDIDL